MAPAIVAADADLDQALPLLAKGGFYHAGQVCVSVQRVFVENTILKDFSDRLVEIASELIVGDPGSDKTEVGPLIRSVEVDRIERWVNEAVASGAKLLCGGKRLENNCFAPTVLLDPSADATISRNEAFGPVVCVCTAMTTWTTRLRRQMILMSLFTLRCLPGTLTLPCVLIAAWMRVR